MRLNKEIKVDVAIMPKVVSSNGSTSQYFSMKDYSSALFVWSVNYSAVQTTTTSTATLYQATDGAGTSAAALASGTAILTAAPKLSQIVIGPTLALTGGETMAFTTYDLFGVAQTQLTYTATGAATNTVTVTRGWKIGSADGTTSNISTSLTNLAAVINADTSTNLYATVDTSYLTIQPINGGETVFLFSASNTTTITVFGGTVMGMIEVSASKLTLSSNFSHVALKVVNESGLYTTAFIIRGGTKRKAKSQQVAVLTELV